jgi:hypothetical protein
VPIPDVQTRVVAVQDQDAILDLGSLHCGTLLLGICPIEKPPTLGPGKRSVGKAIIRLAPGPLNRFGGQGRVGASNTGTTRLPAFMVVFALPFYQTLGFLC